MSESRRLTLILMVVLLLVVLFALARGVGFFLPANITHTAVVLWFSFETATGEHSMLTWQRDGMDYFFPLRQETPFATTPDNMGTHGCGDFKLPDTQVASVLYPPVLPAPVPPPTQGN